MSVDFWEFRVNFGWISVGLMVSREEGIPAQKSGGNTKMSENDDGFSEHSN